MPSAAIESPDINNNHFGNANMGIGYDEDSSELQVRDPMAFDDGGLDQDFDFI